MTRIAAIALVVATLALAGCTAAPEFVVETPSATPTPQALPEIGAVVATGTFEGQVSGTVQLVTSATGLTAKFADLVVPPNPYEILVIPELFAADMTCKDTGLRLELSPSRVPTVEMSGIEGFGGGDPTFFNSIVVVSEPTSESRAADCLAPVLGFANLSWE